MHYLSRNMKVALVHDYLNEYGGAESVLEALSRMYPDAPIYTAFAVPGSSAQKAFTGRRIITSWFQKIPGYQKLYSPLRFLIPWIWGSFDFSQYDLVITSASWYITKGMRRGAAKEVCYCHTPPRWLYGYETSINWRRWWIVKVYALIVGHFLRMYDFEQAQKVNAFIANSRNVQKRIRKFYRREAEVIYPPIKDLNSKFKDLNKFKKLNIKSEYYLMVTRIVGGKGIEMAIEAARRGRFRLVIAGEKAGLNRQVLYSKPALRGESDGLNIDILGRVSDEEKYELMANARAFLALSKDEDFGITPIEAQSVGTPVIAFNGGGYKETVLDGETGVLFEDYSVGGLLETITRFDKIKWNRKVIRENAKKFSEDKFIREMDKVIQSVHAGVA